MIIADYNEDELEEVAQKLISNFDEFKVWGFYAEMGGGKTTLIKKICEEMGVQEKTSSPTFSIVHEYRCTSEFLIYHFDFYRLKNIDEAINIGIEDYLFSEHLCLLEWPEVIEPLLLDKYLQIKINIIGENTRSLTAQPT